MKTLQRVIGGVLAVCLVISLLPVSALAEETMEVTETTAATEVTESPESTETTWAVETTGAAQTTETAATDETTAPTETAETTVPTEATVPTETTVPVETEEATLPEATEPTCDEEVQVEADSLPQTMVPLGFNDLLAYETEGNGSKEKANPIYAGETMVGALDTVTSEFQGEVHPIPDLDYFTFTVRSGEINAWITLLCDYKSMGVTVDDAQGNSVIIALPDKETSNGWRCDIRMKLTKGTYYISLLDADAMYINYSNGYRLYFDSDECKHKNCTTETVEATCLTDGYTNSVCLDCGAWWETSRTPAPGHSYSSDEDSDCNVCGTARDGGGKCGVSVYWLLLDDGTLDIHGTGPMFSYFLKETPWHDIKDKIQRVMIEEGVTKVGDEAFAGCKNLTTAILSEGLTDIGMGAFNWCENLTSAVFPSTLKTIDAYAFCYAGLQSAITIPGNVTRIEAGAFGHCTQIRYINFAGHAPAIEEDAFEEVTAAAYYLSGDTTWTDSVLQSYGGTLTWNAYSNTEKITGLIVKTPPFITRYYVDDPIVLDGLVLEAETETGRVMEIPGDQAILLDYDTSTAGRSSVTMYYSGQRAYFAIIVHPVKTQKVLMPKEGYPIIDEVNVSYCYTAGRGRYLLLKFSEDTYVVNGTIMIYDGHELVEYTDTDLAGQTVATLEGDTVYVSVRSKSEGCSFKVVLDAIYAADDLHTYGDPVTTAPTCTQDGFISRTCFCGYTDVQKDKPATGHSFAGGVCTVCGAEYPSQVLVKTQPNKTVYLVGESIDLTGLELKLQYADGTSQVVTPEDGVALVSGSTENSGRQMLTVGFFGITAQLEIGVHAFGFREELQPSEGYPESEHDYANDFDWTYTYKVPGADYLKLTFSDKTYTNLNYDYIYLYDGARNQIGKYNGDKLAGRTVEIPGDTARIRLSTGNNWVTQYGFSLSSIYAGFVEPVHEPSDEGVYTQGSCYTDGYTTHICRICREEYIVTDPGSGAHSYVDGFCSRCGVPEETVDSGKEQEIYWHLGQNGTLYIMGTGAMTDYASERDLPWKSYRSQITGIHIGADVTRIGDNAFKACDKVTQVSIGSGVTEIGSDAFRSCSALEEIVIPDNVTAIGDHAFRECRGAERLSIGRGITEIAASTFRGCGSLEEIVIPDGVTEIGADAFSGCGGAKRLTIGSGIGEIGSYVFSGCGSLEEIVIPDTVTTLGEGAFSGCSNATSVTIGSGVREIGRMAFWGCSALEEIVIPDNVTAIGDDAFRECRGAKRLSIGRGITEISSEAFYDCRSLTEIVIPEGVTKIGAEAFSECSALEEILIPDQVTVLGMAAFYGCRGAKRLTIGSGIKEIGSHVFSGCGSLEEIVIPDTVTTLGEGAFLGCGNVTSVTIGSGVTQIGNSAFACCWGLTAVSIPDTVRSIGNSSFGYCEALTEVVLGKQVSSIGSSAFKNCKNLKQLSFRGDAPTLAYDAFTDVKATACYIAGNESWTASVLKDYGGKIKWVAQNPTAICLRNEDGLEIGGKTLWIDRTGERTPMTFSAGVAPEELFDYCSWKWTDGPAQVMENADNTVTLTPTGDAGTVVLTAYAGDGSVASFVTLRFVSLVPERAETSGENPADVNLLSGKAAQLKLRDSDSGETFDGKLLRWSLDDAYAPFAKLDGKGKLTAKKVVEKVRVEVVGSVIGSEDTSVTVTVDIFPAVTNLELCRDGEPVNNQTLPLDLRAEPLTLTANLYPLDAMEGISWTISDKKEALASYEIDGNTLTVTPKVGAKPGTVTIKATSADGSKKGATVKLQLAAYADTVTIDKGITQLTAGDKAVQLTATVEPAAVTKPGIVWSLKNPSDKSYVTLSASGKLTPKAVLAPVDVTVVATSKDGAASDAHTIRILPKSAGQLVLKSGETYVTKTTRILDVNTQESVTISAHTYGDAAMTDVTWSPLTHKAGIITVNGDGSLTVQMTAPGSITINAKTADGRKASVTVKGVKLAQKLEISQKKTNITEDDVLMLASGKKLDLQATLVGAAGKKVTWSILEGGQYASVNSSGKVTAKKDLTSGGRVVVKAVAADGSEASDTIALQVRPIAQGVQVYSEEGGRMLFRFTTENWWVRSNTTLVWDLSTQGSSIALDAHVYPYYGADSARNAIQAVTWKSSAPKIANIVNGRLEIYKPGSATITVTAADGSNQKVSFKLNAVKTVTELNLADQTVQGGKSLNLGKLIQIGPADATNQTLLWEITGGNGAAYVTLNAKTGALKTKKVKQAVEVEITATTQDGSGLATTFTVTITP